MKTNWKNECHVEGYIFSIEDNRGYNKLSKAETGPNSKNPGTSYIRGVINVATDAEGLNVVPVYFTYVTETYAKSGKPNDTYKTLAQIIDADAAGTLKTFANSGIDAMKVRIDGDVEINDWMDREGNMVASKRVRGSFCHFVESASMLKPRAEFDVDMLISSAVLREVENGDDYMQLGGYVFNFRGDILTVTFSIDMPEGIAYFEQQDVSSANPLLTNVWGNMITTVVSGGKTVESAFGGPKVEATTRTLSSWSIAGCSPEAMEFDDDATITKAELKQRLTERESRVAAEKARIEERNNSKGGQSAFPVASGAKTASPTADDDFPF